MTFATPAAASTSIDCESATSRVVQALPLVAVRGTTTRLSPVGIVTDDVPAVDIVVPVDWPESWRSVAFRRSNGGAAALVMVPVVDVADAVESEPNNLPEVAQVVEHQSISGRFDEPGDIDCYAIELAEGAALQLAGVTRSAGLSTDLRLRLLGPDGKQVADIDDTGTDEGVLTFTAKLAGRHVLEVSEVFGAGGSSQGYRLERVLPDTAVDLQTDADTILVPPRGTAAISLQVVRRRYNGELELTVTGLPEGLRSETVIAGAGMKRAAITIRSERDEPIRLTGIRIVGTPVAPVEDWTTFASNTSLLNGRLNQPPVVPLALRDSIAVASAEPVPLTLTAEPALLTLGPALSTQFQLKAVRGEGLDEAVTFTAYPAQEALPAEVTLDLQPIAKGSDEVAIKLSATEKAALGRYSIVLQGTLKQGDRTVTTFSPVLNFQLQPALSATVTTEVAEVQRGGELPLQLTLNRNPSLTAAVLVAGKEPPAGVTLADATVPGDQTAAALTLKVGPEFTGGMLEGLKLVLRAEGNDKVQIEVAIPPVKVLDAAE
ncbi:MAG: hypothetical protein R3B90_06400 [Planctomycetaceae bacterium]